MRPEIPGEHRGHEGQAGTADPPVLPLASPGGCVCSHTGRMLVEGLKVGLLQGPAAPVVLLPRQAQGAGSSRGELHHHSLNKQSTPRTIKNILKK